MKNKSKVVFMALAILSTLSCNKEIINSNKKSSTNNNRGESLGTTAAATMVLIPSGTYTRIGFLTDGILPFNCNLTNNSSLIQQVNNSNNTAAYIIRNPNLLGGFPVNLYSCWLTGLAVEQTSAVTLNPNIFLSASTSQTHQLFKASINTSNDYIINSIKSIDAPFAPASAGWKLHDIEFDYSSGSGGTLYGIFVNTSLNQSIVAKIPSSMTNTAPATAIITLNNTKIRGMDFKIQSQITADANKMFLWDANSNSILKLNLITNTYQITLPLPPISALNSSYDHRCSFLAWHPSSTINLELYGEGLAIHVWNKSLNNFTTTFNSMCTATINGGQLNIGNGIEFIITDSGN